MTMLLAAVDPSIVSSGVAMFVDGTLAEVERVHFPDREGAIGHRCATMALAIVSTISRAFPRPPDTLVIEWPQVYRAAKSPGDPNDLLGLAGVGVGVAAQFAAHGMTVIRSPTPHDWTGSLAKERRVRGVKVSPRAARILERLSPAERALIPAQHDAIDAVGLGLWALGRFAPRRVYPGATPHRM
jgi:hypothetical protein